MSTSHRLRVRAMAPGDLEGVAAIEAESFATPWTAATFGQVLRHPETSAALVLEMTASESASVEVPSGVPDTDQAAPDGADPPRAPGSFEVVGYAILRFVGSEGELLNIAVRGDLRGRGLGGFLLDRVLEVVRDRGISLLFLEVRRSNEAAIRMYEARGFQFVGIRRAYYTRPVEDAKIMLLKLDESQRKTP